MRSHYFMVTVNDEAGRVQSRLIRHHTKNLTAPVINSQLEENNAYQPVAVTAVSYLGKMSDRYFETGIKSISDQRWPWLLLPVAIMAIALIAYFA